MVQQSSEVGLGAEVVPLPPGRIIDRELEIDQDQGRGHPSILMAMSSSKGRQAAKLSAK